MGFWKNAAYTAAGIGLSELIHDQKKDNKTSSPKTTLEDIIDNYAHEHDIWGRDEHFYQYLLRIADKYHDPYA